MTSKISPWAPIASGMKAKFQIKKAVYVVMIAVVSFVVGSAVGPVSALTLSAPSSKVMCISKAGLVKVQQSGLPCLRGYSKLDWPASGLPGAPGKDGTNAALPKFSGSACHGTFPYEGLVTASGDISVTSTQPGIFKWTLYNTRVILANGSLTFATAGNQTGHWSYSGQVPAGELLNVNVESSNLTPDQWAASCTISGRYDSLDFTF